jgi:hypothetical protein
VNRRSHALRRRYGRHSDRRGAGHRSYEEMAAAERAKTIRAPRLSMREQIEHDRAERAHKQDDRRYGHGMILDAARFLRHPVREWRAMQTDIRLANEGDTDALDARLEARYG